jgi:hypothetical protein
MKIKKIIFFILFIVLGIITNTYAKENFKYNLLNDYFFEYNNKIYSKELYNVFLQYVDEIKEIKINKIPSITKKDISKIEGKYLFTKNNIYYLENEIKEADIKSFQILSEKLSKDKNNIYYENNKINLDFNNFKLLDKFHFTDGKELFYISENKQQIRYTIEELFRISDVDIKTYKILDRIFSKDKNNVYYEDSKIIGADSATFEKIDNTYSKDKDSVFYQKYLIKEANNKTFKILKENFSRDNENIYWKNYKITKYNDSFEILGDGFLKINNRLYETFLPFTYKDLKTLKKINNHLWLDKNNVYYINLDANIIIINDNMNIEKKTFNWEKFRKIKYNYYTDENYVYYNDKIVSSDINNFQILSENYSKDSQNIYYKMKKIRNADLNSFKVVGKIYAKDCNNAYIRNEILKNVDIKSFKKLKNGLLVDNENAYGIEY